jgi:tripartite-type tricarboxylate transporter receptor subunit TctC
MGLPKLSVRKSIGLGLKLGLLAMTLPLNIAAVQAQSADTLRIVVPYPPGGSSDRGARLLADALRIKLNAPVVVENITGAGGRVAMQQISRMPADTNVLVMVNPALMVVAPLVFKNIGYDAEKDFQAVSVISTYEMALAVAPTVAAADFNQLKVWLKANPEKSNFGVPATGSLPHFFALMVADKAEAKAQVVGYRGSAPLMTDLIGGHVPVAIDAFEALDELHTAGKVKILATSGSKRAMSTVPTFKEVGLNLEATGWNALYAKSSMPSDKVAKLGAAIAEVMAQPGIRQQISAQKAEPVSASTEQSKATVKSFKDLWVPVITKSGLQLE